MAAHEIFEAFLPPGDGLRVETLFFDNSEGRHERHVFLERPGGVLRLVFVANPDLDSDEVEAMIAAVEVGPFVD